MTVSEVIGMPVPIEYEDLHDKAVVWVFTKSDRKGDPRVSSPIEVSVRWEEGNFEIPDAEGNRIQIDVTLATTRQLRVGSLMWEGSLVDLSTEYPTNIPTKDIYEVVLRNRAKDTKGMFTRWEFGLRRYKDKLPSTG